MARRFFFSIGTASVALGVHLAFGDSLALDPLAPDAGDSGSSPSDAAPSDATVPSGPCDPLAPFTKTESVVGPDGAWSPRFTPDELTIYVAAPSGKNPGTFDIFTATRATRNDPFGAFVKVPITRDTGGLYPMPTPDGLGLYFAANAVPGQASTYFAHRPNLEVPFTADDGTSLVDIPGAGNTQFMSFLPNADIMYFAGQNDAGYGVYRGNVIDGGIADARLLPILVNAENDAYPVVTGDELHLYWAERTWKDQNTFTVYEAHRTSRATEFTERAPMTIINDFGPQNFPSWISGDNCRLYFTSTQGAAKKFAMFLASKTP